MAESDPEKTSLSRQDAERILRLLLNRNPAYRVFGIIFSTPTTYYKLQEPQQKSPEKRIWIVLDQDVVDTSVSARMVRAMPEIISLVFSVGSCVTLGVASTIEVAVVPVSGGLTMALAALTWTGAVASAASAGISSVRVYNEIFGDPENNDLMDSTAWVNYTMLALDGVAIASLSASRFPLLFSLLKNGKTPGTAFKLAQMTRGERKELTKEFGRVMVGTEIKSVLSKKAISQLITKELLEVSSSALGIFGSLYSGSLGAAFKFVIRIAVVAID